MKMKEKKVLVIGSTGLVGEQLINSLIKLKHIKSIICLVRRPVDKIHEKLDYKIVDFKDEKTIVSIFNQVDSIYCCIGTTIKKAKSKEKFKFVDLDIPVKIAKIGIENGVKSFNLVSSAGASHNSIFFYLNVKALVEDKIKKMGFQKFFIYRPSLLIGKRKEFRLAEVLMLPIFKYLNPIIPKPYQATNSKVLAEMMVKNNESINSGVHIFEAKDIHE